jgi:hypothetical protein
VIHSLPRTPSLRPALLAALALLPLALLGATTRAAAPRRARNPHGSFKQECALCHGAEAWKPARISSRFDHGRSGFALAGAHASAQCTSCHATLEFKQAALQCVTCHEDVHRGELGPECARCHSAVSFLDRSAMVQMHQLTRFPLIGGHSALDCESCHPPTVQGHMRFVGAQADCQACHMEDYRAARSPDHAAGGFSTDCAVCHAPITWNSARFDHNRTAFPLTGAHRSTSCQSCHGDGVYRGKSTACVSCHQGDYDGTTDPNHAAAGFSTDCAACHNTTGWDGANFDHDASFFPINSGTHRGRWSNCSECHVSPTNFAQFTCFSCHPHSDRAKTDGDHSGEGGYVYDSQACYACHPRGRK